MANFDYKGWLVALASVAAYVVVMGGVIIAAMKWWPVAVILGLGMWVWIAKDVRDIQSWAKKRS